MFPSAERRRWNLGACFVYCWSEWWRRFLQAAVLQRLSAEGQLFCSVHRQSLEERKRIFDSEVCGWVWTCWISAGFHNFSWWKLQTTL